MKVILLKELKGRGGEGDVVEVARGFAVNYLFPRKVAIEATEGNLKQLEMRAHNIRAREEQRLEDAQALREQLDGKTIRIEAKVGEEGQLFGSVTSSHVGAVIAEQLGIEVDRRKIETHGHIKNVGPHPVNVAIYRDVKADLTVDVVGEGVAVAEVPAVVAADTADAAAPENAPEEEAPAEAVEASSEQAATDPVTPEAVEEGTEQAAEAESESAE
jgi:large subunit ribosomal protein L9